MNEKLRKKLELLFVLNGYVNEGIGLYVEDEPSTPQNVVERVMESSCSYMADFVKDDRGKLCEIRYDMVSAS